jgi:hypothetical protein
LPRSSACCHRSTRWRAQPQPISELMLALECGGSDGWSGVTANPVLGLVSDEIVRQGGTVILSETSEIYGAEDLLTQRAVSRAVGEQLVELVHWWEEHTRQNGVEIDGNPSPGNKAGGLTTIFEKSLGAVAKAGSTPLMAVYHYAEPVTARGMVFMDTPGYDPVATTGQVAGGANLVLFTTGRGSVFGFKPAPSIKIATNSAMFERMQMTWISTPGACWKACRWPRWLANCSTWWWLWRQASPPRARRRAWVKRNSRHGESAQLCSVLRRLASTTGCAILSTVSQVLSFRVISPTYRQAGLTQGGTYACI